MRRPCQPKQSSLGRMLTNAFHIYCKPLLITYFFNGILRFADYDKEHTARVTDQQRMLTLQWHLILPNFVEVHVCSAPVLHFSSGLLVLEHRLLSPHIILIHRYLNE